MKKNLKHQIKLGFMMIALLCGSVILYLRAEGRSWSDLLAQSEGIDRASLALVGVMIVLCVMMLAYLYDRGNKLAVIRHRLEEEQKSFLELVSNMNGGLIMIEYPEYGSGGTVVFVNEVFERMTGYSLTELQDRHQGDLIGLVHPEDDPDGVRAKCRALPAGQSYQQQYRLRRKDGSYLWVMDSGYVQQKENGTMVNQIFYSDISLLKAQEEALRLNRESFRTAATLVNGFVFEYDIGTKQYLLMENMDRIFGSLKESELFQLSQVAKDKDYYHPDDRQAAKEARETLCRNGHVQFLARILRDGTYIWCQIHMILIYDEQQEVQRVIGNIIDIDETQSKLEQLQAAADQDPLTHIYNRSAFYKGVMQILQSYPGRRHAFFLLDIDDFKGINDNNGHLFGDEVLVDAAQKLGEQFRTTDLVGRMGGDEFIMFMSDVRNMDAVEAKAEEICDMYRTTRLGKQQDIKISCSLGVTMYEPFSGSDYETLYRQADAALYEAKDKGKDTYAIYPWQKR